MSEHLFANVWRWLFDGTYPEWLVVSVVSFLVHEIFYFGAYIPFLIADFVPSLRKYKIQSDIDNSWELQWNCIRRVLFNHFCIQLPMIMMAHPAFEFMGMSTKVETLPSLPKVLFLVVCFFFIEDFYFYWVHRLLHWGPMYKYVHKMHHHHPAPFGIVGEYAHPIETFILGFGTILGPFLLADHLLTLWAWLVFRLFQVIEAHSGYDFPWSLNNWLPLWGGAEFHDFHHMTFQGNYASTLTLWDRVFGTDANYRHAKKGNRQELQRSDIRPKQE